MLGGNTLAHPQLELVGEERDKNTRPPVRHLPLKEVLVPLAHLEAAALALWLIGMLAVGVVGGPALSVDAPYCPGLNSARATFLPQTLPPLTCNEDKRDTERVLIKKINVCFRKVYWFKLLLSSVIPGLSLKDTSEHLTSVFAISMSGRGQ